MDSDHLLSATDNPTNPLDSFSSSASLPPGLLIGVGTPRKFESENECRSEFGVKIGAVDDRGTYCREEVGVSPIRETGGEGVSAYERTPIEYSAKVSPALVAAVASTAVARTKVGPTRSRNRSGTIRRMPPHFRNLAGVPSVRVFFCCAG